MSSRMKMRFRGMISAWMCLAVAFTFGNRFAGAQEPDPGVQKLKSEVADKGWILFSDKSDKGDYDLFICRPDGSGKRNLTQTPGVDELGARISPGTRKMLYRSLSKETQGKSGEVLNHDTWGAMGVLVFANADGSDPQPQGKDQEWPWASLSPDGKQLACLYKREGKIRIVEAESKKLLRELPRQGIFQQLYWSGDGKRFCGTANLEGRNWNILTMDLETGKSVWISRSLCCTPDWFTGNSDKVIYSCRMPGLANEYGWTMLMQASADGKSRSLLYGERERHVYYGCTSPDDAYVVFSVPGGDARLEGEMAIIRLADAPIVAPADYVQLKELYPEAKTGPVLRLHQAGFEADWIYAEFPGK